MTQGQSQVKVLSIHEFAQMCRTTPRTLRFYEQKGLFKPAKVDKYTGYRHYLPEQARKFSEIKFLQNFDIPLREMPLRLGGENTRIFLDEKLNKLQAEIKEKKKIHNFLKEMRQLLLEKNQITLKPKTVGPYKLLVWRIEHGVYNQVSNYCLQIRQEAKRLRLEYEKQNLVFYLNWQYQPKDAPLEIALICKNINNSVPLPQNYFFRNFPKTKVLSFLYKGPFEFMDLVYSKMDEYATRNQINRLPFDINIHGPLDKTSKYDYTTLICYPAS